MADTLNLVKTLHPYEIAVIKALLSGKKSSVEELAIASGFQEIEVKRAIQWLTNKNLITTENVSSKAITLGKYGQKYKTEGLPEIRILKVLAESHAANNSALTVEQIEAKAKLETGEFNSVIGVLKRKVAADIVKNDKGELVVSITENGKKLLHKPSLEEQFFAKTFPIIINNIDELTPEERFGYDSLSKRKDLVLLEETKTTLVELTAEGKDCKDELNNFQGEFADKLTPEMLKDGSWKNKEFRHYDVTSEVPRIAGGKKHFVNQAIEYMKSIWIELGFEEMSGNICQTGFWDLDALFVPQDHPARQMQDSFFVADFDNNDNKNNANNTTKILKGKLPPLAEKVKIVHENGGDTGSTGWGGKWSSDFSSEVMLRTHTTVLSAQYIASKLEFDENGKVIPRKFFSVNKVFRNETPDWKHLFEFNQVEGIVVDEDANLQNLLGYLKAFFAKMGFTDVRIRPAHFPYTEPSAEIEVYNPKKQQWVELGGSGIFRPEVSITLIGKEVPVLAWGLGMERIIVEYFDLHDLRDLYKNDIKQLKEMKSWTKISEN